MNETSGCGNTIDPPEFLIIVQMMIWLQLLYMRRNSSFLDHYSLYVDELSVHICINQCNPSPYKVHGNVYQDGVIRNRTWLIE